MLKLSQQSHAVNGRKRANVNAAKLLKRVVEFLEKMVPDVHNMIQIVCIYVSYYDTLSME